MGSVKMNCRKVLRHDARRAGRQAGKQAKQPWHICF